MGKVSASETREGTSGQGDKVTRGNKLRGHVGKGSASETREGTW